MNILNPQEGIKKDEGKCRLDLLPLDSLWEVGNVLTIGARKYNSRNWEQGINYGRIQAALLRHLFRWWNGEERDPEDKQLHLSSVAWCSLVLLHYELNKNKYNEFDDRPKDQAQPWNSLKTTINDSENSNT